MGSRFKAALSTEQRAFADIPLRTRKSRGGLGLGRKATSLTLDAINWRKQWTIQVEMTKTPLEMQLGEKSGLGSQLGVY